MFSKILDAWLSALELILGWADGPVSGVSESLLDHSWGIRFRELQTQTVPFSTPGSPPPSGSGIALPCVTPSPRPRFTQRSQWTLLGAAPWSAPSDDQASHTVPRPPSHCLLVTRRLSSDCDAPLLRPPSRASCCWWGTCHPPPRLPPCP